MNMSPTACKHHDMRPGVNAAVADCITGPHAARVLSNNINMSLVAADSLEQCLSPLQPG